MHQMYHVSTEQGEYAVKVLNPAIMKRPEALQNMINSEMVSRKLERVIPVVVAKSFGGKNIIEYDDSYYIIFDWLEGNSIFVPHISEYHCEQVGRILGKIHAANINVSTIEKSQDNRDEYDWDMLLEKAQQYSADCYVILKENLSDIVRWDKCVVSGLHETSQNQVISHGDLDPKNVMWKEEQPYIIDWESAGYVNPYQELIEVLNYWIADETGNYSKKKFESMIQAYTENINISHVNWEAVLNCSFDGMLGWLEYSIKRAIGMEGADNKDWQEGMEQTTGTICELKKYDNQIDILKEWINEYVSKKYTI